jgi:putative NADPH-quinone reductase
MTFKHILLIQRHPDVVVTRLCHALAASYASGAHDAGHLVRWIQVAELVARPSFSFERPSSIDVFTKKERSWL